MAIQDVITRMATQIEAISGIKGVDKYAPEDLPTTDLWVVLDPGIAEFIGGQPAGTMTALYKVNIDLYTPRNTLPYAIQRLLPYYDDIPNALYDDLFDTKLNNTVSTFGTITTSEITPVDYAGVSTLRLRYTVHNIKLQSVVS